MRKQTARVLGLMVLVAALGTVWAMPAAAQTPTDVARKVVCQCGCTAVLDACPHKECTVGEGMKADIRAKLASGQSESQIIQSFVATYGEVVLAAPTKKGFNLTAWITPFVALAAGAVLVYFLLTRWVFRGREAPALARPQQVSADEPYRQRVERELEELRHKEGLG